MKEYTKGMILALLIATAILLSTYIVFQNVIGKLCFGERNLKNNANEKNGFESWIAHKVVKIHAYLWC